MQTKYVYSICHDTLNKKVDIDSLSQEVRDSDISKSLDYMSTYDDTLEIWFKDILSENNQFLLTTIVNSHSGEPVPEVLEKKTPDGKLYVNSTSRPIGSTICFSSEGDDPSSRSLVGGGTPTVLQHEIGDPTTQTLYLDLNIKENPTYLHEGYIMWEGAFYDSLSMRVVPKVTPVTPGTGTFFNLYGGYLIVPANGDGLINVNTADMQLVEMLPNIETNIRPAAYWDADYDSTNTHSYLNIRPNYNAKGCYNMFGTEVTLNVFARNLLMLNSGFIQLQTSESSEIGDGMRIVFETKTHGDDHKWSAAGILTMHRKRTG